MIGVRRLTRNLAMAQDGAIQMVSPRRGTHRGGLMLQRIKRIGSTLLLLALALTQTTGTAWAQGTIKIMYTDPLSGPFAQVGDQNLQQFKYIIDYINGRG